MSLNRELNDQLTVRETEYEEREVKAVEEAREACIAFYENSKREFARQLGEDAKVELGRIEEENVTLKERLAEAIAEVNEARQNYVQLSKESREELEEEKRSLIEEKEKAVGEVEDTWREKF